MANQASRTDLLDLFFTTFFAGFSASASPFSKLSPLGKKDNLACLNAAPLAVETGPAASEEAIVSLAMGAVLEEVAILSSVGGVDAESVSEFELCDSLASLAFWTICAPVDFLMELAALRVAVLFEDTERGDLALGILLTKVGVPLRDLGVL